MVKEIQNNTKKRNNANKLKVAVFCIGAIVIFYIGANFLKGLDVFSKKTYYYAVFDNLNGVNSSTPLMMNGYKIGKVTKITLMSDNPVKIVVEILVTEKINVPSDSKLTIASSGLLGGNILNLKMGSNMRTLSSGDTLQFLPAEGALNSLLNQVSNVVASVDTIALSLKEALVTQNGSGDIKHTLVSLKHATANLNDIVTQNKSKIGALVSNIETFSLTLKAASPQLNHLVANFDNIADTLVKANIAGVMHNLDKTVAGLESMLAKVNSGEGTVGQLIHNDTLYNNLQNITESLNNLVKDLKENPNRYVHISVFGKKEKKSK
ncbi:MAG: MlaD family protein [Bacteroidales bacterium]|jgi:phospholipid/cholesterol/gamma-HCH transport system substrate-binding protein|nr:MlaD family protein [Bacteroidales bacterium]